MSFADFAHWLNLFVADACMFDEPNSNQLGVIRSKLDEVIASDRERADRLKILTWRGAEPIVTDL